MDLCSLTITQAHKGLTSNKFSSVELTKACLDRIKKTDDKLKAFVTVTEDLALKQAEKVDEKISKGEEIGMVEGIPCSFKDMFNLKGVKCTAASKILENYVSPYDASVVEKLRSEGSVFLGKTNQDQFAHGSSTETSAFFTTVNPWDPKKLSGGSSGGSAASVVAGQSVFSLGTETGGSIRHPASWCSCVGFKPTYGRASRYGIIAMASSLDCPGPITKTVEDTAIVLDVICGEDPKDATTSPKAKENYFKNLSGDVKGLKIGIAEEYLSDDVDDEVKKAVRAAVKEFEKMGAKTVEISLMEPKYSVAVYTIIQRSEVSSNLARYDGVRYGLSAQEAEDILDLYLESRKQGFGDEAKNRIMTGTYSLSAGYYDAYYLKAQKVRTLIKQDLDKAFEKVDVIITPGTPVTALPLGASEESPMYGELCDLMVLANTLAGCTGVVVPCGFDKGNMPIGMQIYSKRFNEQVVLNAAYAYERETEWSGRRPEVKSKSKQ